MAGLRGQRSLCCATYNKPLQTDEPQDEPVSGFAALDAAAYGLRVVRLVPAGAGPGTIVETL